MEKHITIPTSDWFEISGVLNCREKSDKLIIFVHGFTGNLNEAHYVCARDFFLSRGYATFRFNLYSAGRNHRKLHTTTVEDHSFDTQKVIDYFHNIYTDISLVGHSLGWPTIIWVPNLSQIHKIILWDPALEMRTNAKKIFSEDGKYFIPSGSGKNIEVWKEMLDEFENIDYFTKLQSLEFLKEDIWIIYASEDRHVVFQPELDKLWIKNYTIQWADHCFTREWNFQELFEETLEYIEK